MTRLFPKTPGVSWSPGYGYDYGVSQEWRLDKVMIFSGICFGVAFLSSGGGDG
jgi:hypothetical protein